MNKRSSSAKSIFLLVIILCLASLNAFSQEFSINESPLGAPTSPVMDYAGVLDAGAKQALEKRIIDFRDKTNPKVELAVAVVKTTGDRPIFDYSLAVARGWKIGSKETDNPSALLFVAIDDRKYFTHVSKDLEDELPDGVVGQLQRQNLVPAFKQGNYTKGVTDTIEAYIRTIESKQTGEQPAVNSAPTTGRTRERGGVRSSSSLGGVCCLIIAFFVILAIFSRSSRRGGNNNDRWRGGGFGGGGGGSVLPWVIGSVIANSIGNSSGSSSSSSDWGGSSGGGGDSWGGFGGGGDFGGGGAGGDW